MRIAKDGVRSIVRVGYDGKVYKTFRGTDRDKRFANEVHVLKVLEARGCDFVPRLIDADEETLTIVTTNCGQPVTQLSEEKQNSLFAELTDKFGVVHDDPFMRNITYQAQLGRFCIIDFELAEILDEDGVESDSSNPLSLSWAGMTQAGRRKPGNDDSFAIFSSQEGWAKEHNAISQLNLGSEGVVLAVSDGMGGVKGGEVASQLAVSELRRFLPGRMGDFSQNAEPLAVLSSSVTELHELINRTGAARPEIKGMGATLVCGLFHGTEMHFAHVGDSRIYRFREGELKQLTFDHSRVGKMFREGKINEREARNHPSRNVLNQVLGANLQVLSPQVGSAQLKRGDWMLFCSDGVIDGLWDKSVHQFFQEASQQDSSAEAVAERFLTVAVRMAGNDDTTLIVVKVC